MPCFLLRRVCLCQSMSRSLFESRKSFSSKSGYDKIQKYARINFKIAISQKNFNQNTNVFALTSIIRYIQLKVKVFTVKKSFTIKMNNIAIFEYLRNLHYL